MNKNITFLIFAVAGILVGFFLGRESTDSPNLIDESSRSLVDLTETIAQNQKTIDELMADLDRAQSSLKNARKVQNEVDVLRIQLATNSKDSP